MPFTRVANCQELPKSLPSLSSQWWVCFFGTRPFDESSGCFGRNREPGMQKSQRAFDVSDCDGADPVPFHPQSLQYLRRSVTKGECGFPRQHLRSARIVRASNRNQRMVARLATGACVHASAFGFLSVFSGYLVSFDMVDQPDNNAMDRAQASVASKLKTDGTAIARGWKLLGRSSALAWALRDGVADPAFTFGGIALAEHSMLCADTSSQKSICIFCFGLLPLANTAA